MQQCDRLKQQPRDFYFNAIHCDRSASTCEYKKAELSQTDDSIMPITDHTV